MKAAGVVTGFLPIPTPVLLVGPEASVRLGQALAGFGHRRILIVTDAQSWRSWASSRGSRRRCTRAGAEYVVFDAVTADAPIPVIEKGIAFYQRRGCDAIVAFGGGSPMDAAKVIAYAVANRKPPRKLVGYFKGLRAPLPLYAVPTTAGTGSEVTVAAVISDPEAGQKLVIADTRLVPAMAALDPTLMTGLPPAVTAATGMDALTHAVEAFIGQWATDHHRPHGARRGRARLREPARRLPRAARNLEARERMSLAATYAGLAFTRANVGYVHAIAHQLGGRYHVPHGLANAILLPHVLRFLAPAVTKRLARLAVAAGVGTSVERPSVLAKRFIESVEKLNRDVKIPRTLDALRKPTYRRSPGRPAGRRTPTTRCRSTCRRRTARASSAMCSRKAAASPGRAHAAARRKARP